MSRLIDADALIENRFKNDISYNAFVKLVKRQTTVDAVPARAAKWEHYRSGQLSCSECGENAPVIERWYCNGEYDFPKYESWGTPYCPFCGSRMVNGEK